MASIIRIKRSATGGNPGTLAAGEFAYSSLTDNGSNGGDRLYLGHGTETGGDAATHEIIGGKYFTDQLDHVKGTLTANSAILVDGNKKVNELLVDALLLDSNTISTTIANRDIVLAPNGTGVISVNSKNIVDVATPTQDDEATNKSYVDAAINTANATQNLTYGTDGGGGTANLGTEVVNFVGLTGITTSVSTGDSDEIRFDLDDTAVTPAAYGSTTAIPVITIDQQGRITNATTATVATTLALSGNTGTDTIDLLTDTFAIEGATGGEITVAVASNKATLTMADASAAQKGVAKFDATDFTAASGAITVNAVTLGSSLLNPGETTSALAGLTRLDADNMRLDGNTLSSTDSANSTMTIDPGNNNAVSGKVIIRGDLQIDGTQTQINSTTMTVEDINLTLANGAGDSAAANGAGITIAGSNAGITYNTTTGAFDVNKNFNLTTGKSFKVNNVALTELIDDQVGTLATAGEAMDITYDDGAGTLTFAAELATTTNLGVASFDASFFNVTSGVVTIHEVNGGTY